MNTTQLNYLQGLFREGTFTKAAKKIGISQSTLSKFLQSLESEIGAPLFIRSKGKLIPTPHGYIYLNMADKIEALQNQMFHEIYNKNKENSQEIVLGIPPYWNSKFISTILKRFQVRYPNIKISILETNPELYPDLLKRKKINIAISLDDNGVSSGVRHIALKKSSILIAIPTTYMEQHNLVSSSLKLQEITNLPLIMPAKPSYLYYIARNIFAEQPQLLQPIISSSNVYNRLALIKEGLGYTILLGENMESMEGISLFHLHPEHNVIISLLLADEIILTEEQHFMTELIESYYESENGYES